MAIKRSDTESTTCEPSHVRRPFRPIAAAGWLAILVLSGCNKSEHIPTTEERLKSVQTKQESQPDFFAPRKATDYTADLKTLRDTPRTDAPQKAATPGAPGAPGVASSASAPTEAAKLTEPRSQPSVAQPIVPAATPSPTAAAPTPTPPPGALPPSAPSAPAPSRPSADTTVTVLSRIQPTFPRDAIRQGVEDGNVRARATLNANGDVTNVTIVSSRPGRVFDREVQQTLQRWKFNAGAEGRVYETEIEFRR